MSLDWKWCCHIGSYFWAVVYRPWGFWCQVQGVLTRRFCRLCLQCPRWQTWTSPPCAPWCQRLVILIQQSLSCKPGLREWFTGRWAPKHNLLFAVDATVELVLCLPVNCWAYACLHDLSLRLRQFTYSHFASAICCICLRYLQPAHKLNTCARHVLTLD